MSGRQDDHEFGNQMFAFGSLINALSGGKGGDIGQSFPQSDADDFSKGLRFVPGEVTLARRRGDVVKFHQPCSNKCCWYWQFPDGSRTYYWESNDFESIKKANRAKGIYTEGKEGVGPCPLCNNPHTTGGHIEKP